MSTESPAATVEETTRAAADEAEKAVNHGQKILVDAIAKAEKTIIDSARSTEKALKDGFQTLRDQARPYADNASQSVDDAQRYVADRVKERPLTATLIGLGLGVFVGLLIASRDR